MRLDPRASSCPLPATIIIFGDSVTVALRQTHHFFCGRNRNPSQQTLAIPLAELKCFCVFCLQCGTMTVSKQTSVATLVVAAAFIASISAFSTLSPRVVQRSVQNQRIVAPSLHFYLPKVTPQRKPRWSSLYADTSGGASTAVQATGGEDGESTVSEDNDDDDISMMPSDPASNTTEFLTGLWQLIAQGNSMVRGVS